eukprot:UN06032
MAFIFKAIATPFTVLGTAISGTGDEKLWYTCPGCRKQVYVYKKYASWKGEECFGCNGVDEHKFRSRHDGNYNAKK